MSEFKEFKEKMQEQFARMAASDGKLFVTGIEKDVIWETYLDSFPAGTNEVYRERREYDCSACRQFMRPYGNVVAIDGNDELVSIWDLEGLKSPYKEVAQKLSELVKSASIVNVFIAPFQKLGVDKNHEEMADGTVHTWEHFYFKIPKCYVHNGPKSIEAAQGIIRDTKQVFQRSMQELTLDAANTIMELIDQGSLYRGEEHRNAITAFSTYKRLYGTIPEEKQDNWCWIASVDNPVGRIRNTAIGTLLIDLSNEVDLDTAVRKFEAVMAPANYKRPKAIFTKKMVEEAEAEIEALGFSDSLGRKHAVLEDITVNNVLFVDRDSRSKLGGSVFDDLKDDVPETVKNFDKVEEISAEDFFKNVVPTAKSIELMMESRHRGNLMSLIAPKKPESKSMLKWSNNFGWAYNGDMTDSMKQNVKNAGGNVDGILRFSIQWNDGDNNQNDFDAHCIEPNGNLICYRNKRKVHASSGMLDVDIQRPGDKVAVENITWTDKSRMKEGEYQFRVHNYSHNGGRTGFTAEIEYEGEIHSFEYPMELRSNEKVQVASIVFNRKTGIKFNQSLNASTSTKEIWGVNTNKFTKVSVGMFSPNYWDGQKGIGNKHYFFFLDGCKNEAAPRGFYNEFLNEGLTPHKRVFEALGSKMRVEPTEDQLSGLGFSTTQRNSVIARIEGNFKRVLKITF